MITVDEVDELVHQISDLNTQMTRWECYQAALKIIEINNYRDAHVLGEGVPSALECIAMGLNKK
tara:strand:- start:60 stop:251 length:192 start_codon:yes stop_codon:yes gene_type:complete